MKFGIIGAMEEEISALKEEIIIQKLEKNNTLEFHIGKFLENDVVIVRAGIGKVNAAMTTQSLINLYKPDYIINIGVAGAVDPSVEIGDIIVSEDLIEHDFDATAFGYEKGQIPRLENWKFKGDKKLIDASKKAGNNLGYNIIEGRIVSGDIFVGDNDTKKRLFDEFGAKCCEMEGAAIAHVSEENGIPFVVYRAISDKADSKASNNYEEFVLKACKISKELIVEVLKQF